MLRLCPARISIASVPLPYRLPNKPAGCLAVASRPLHRKHRNALLRSDCDELGVQVGLHGLRATFRAVTGILHAAKWRLRQSEAMVVDRHQAAFKARTERVHGTARACICI